MANTVGVNKMSVVTKDSNGVSVAFPDVCKTPSPAGPIPLPYPNVARSADTAQGSKTVAVEGNPLCVKDSNFSTSTGDEAGTAGAEWSLARPRARPSSSTSPSTSRSRERTWRGPST